MLDNMFWDGPLTEVNVEFHIYGVKGKFAQFVLSLNQNHQILKTCKN